MSFLATVLICTHNPRLPILARVLNALKAQTEPARNWELLIVDNCSPTPVAAMIDVSWQPHARLLSESRLGKTHATLLGFRESRSPLIIIVDDDNILCPTYIADAIRIAGDFPFLGAWGGLAKGEFETPPPEWALSRLDFIAVRDNDCDRPLWTNEYFRPQPTPIGAGMCLRKAVADAYVDALAHDSIRQSLGPNGEALSRCEDIDLAYTAIDLGLGVGRFPNLVLTHVIPKERLTEKYFLQLVESASASNVMMHSLRGAPIRKQSWPRRLWASLRLLSQPAVERRFLRARNRGLTQGHDAMAQLARKHSAS